MDLAESLMGEAPDSSLATLQRMDALTLPTRGLRARYALSLTMARDKCYMDVSLDTTIRMAYEWYQHHGSKKDRMLSAYYMGVVQQQAGNSLEAALAFREAEPLAEELADYRQLSLIEQHLSGVFARNYDHVRALEYAKKSLESAEMAEEKLMADYCRYDLAVQWFSEARYEEAEAVLSDVLNSNKNYPQLYSYAAQLMAEICLVKRNPDFDTADKYYQEIMRLGEKNMNGHDYGLLALICEHKNEPEKADAYLEAAWNTLSTVVDSTHYYNDCRNVYDQRKDWEKAHWAKTESVKIQNRIVIQLLGQSVSHALENHYEDKWEVEQLQSRVHIYMFVLITTLLLAVVSGVIIIIIRRNNAVLDDMARAQDLSNDLVNTLIAAKITELQQLSESYFLWDDQSVKKREEKKGLLSRDEIISSFRSQLSELRNDHSFISALEQSLNVKNNDLMKKVRQELSDEKELDFSILTLLFSGFSIKSISFLFRMSEPSLRMRKTRYKQRFELLQEPERSYFLRQLK